jgi:hypothetical protein
VFREGDLLLDREKHPLDIQIHHLIPPILLIDLVNVTSPCSARIRKQNVHVIGVLLYLFDQSLNLGYFGAVGGNGVCFRARLFVGKCVEGCNGFIARAGFAAGDENFGAACL